MITQEDIQNTIIQLLKTEYKSEYHDEYPDKITEYTNLQSMGFDSLDITYIIMKFENLFNIKIPDEDIDNFDTVGSCTKYICFRKGLIKTQPVPSRPTIHTELVAQQFVQKKTNFMQKILQSLKIHKK